MVAMTGRAGIGVMQGGDDREGGVMHGGDDREHREAWEA